ncbi:hypothetical protein OU426_08845 [Frigidibacter sp. RF13]|uniref:hypothetical protein n=1 Tax=Frigidibacter sp. RF13 TaxID=2997340 RepID=UPI00226ECA97|nr:hypothetical protein [Frigidibacter sp. RF13]MCY1126960.1 hypothetical protein [Frigidibacter sp. RF13]
MKSTTYAGLLALLPVFDAAAALAAPPSTASQVPGLEILPLPALPPAPADRGEPEFCDHLLTKARTPGGKVAEALGWAVTAEAPFGAYQAVSFVGHAEPATSGACNLSQGNIAFFRGDRLVALAYAAEGAPSSIGRITPFGVGGLRVWSGDLIPAPVADIRPVGPDGIALTPPASEQIQCDGKARLPYLYGLPVDLARILLAEAGWQPVDQAASGTRSPGQADDIAAAGIIEVEDCAGTGFAFCSYAYQGEAGDLSLVTAGEIGADGSLPFVTGYGVTCQAAP